MRDDQKTKAELLRELDSLRCRVSELEQVEETLKHSKKKFKELIENTFVGVYRTTSDGRITMANPALVRMLGYSSFEELSQRNLEKERFAHQYQRSIFKDLIEREGKVVGLESAWRKRDGTTLFITENAWVVRDESGKTLYYEGILQDITERKEAEDKINQAAEDWSKTFDAISDLVFVQDKDFKLIKVNKSVCDLLKVKLGDLIGKKCYEVLHKSDKPWTNCPFVNALKDKRPHIEEVYDPNIGVPLLISTSPLFDENGELTGAVHIAKDITERKKLEEALRKFEEKYRKLFKETTDAIFVADAETGTLIDCNSAAAELVGREKSELVGKHQRILHPPEEIEGEFSRTFKQHIKEKEGQVLEAQVITKKGQIKDVEIRASCLELQGEKCVQGIFRDITERKKAEERQTLRFEISKTFHSQKSLENMCKKIVSLIKEYLDCEVVALRMKEGDDYPYFVNNGFSQKFIKSENYLCIHDEKEDCLRDSRGHLVLACMCGIVINAKFNQDKPFFAKEGSFWTNSTSDLLASTKAEDRGATTRNVCNQYGYESVALIPIKVKSDNIGLLQINDKRRNLFSLGSIQLLEELGRIIGIAIESKKAEEALNESEQKYRTLVESAGESIATINEDGVFLFINRTGAERFGGKPKDYIGKTMWDLFPKKIADRQAASVRKVINTGEGRNEVALTGRQGQLRWYNTTLEPLRDSSGKVTAVMVVARDIHMLKQAEEELNKYREQMAKAEQLASVGTLSATLAHELTQPLTVIRLSIQNSLAVLETVSCPGTVVEDLKEGLSEISSLTSIIDRFRNFARISSERTVSEVDLKAVAERIVKLLDESAWRVKVTLQVEGMDKLPPIYSHEKDLEQLFFSLIENAIQAANGKKSRQVIISGAVRDGHIELQFSDNCGGIAPGNLDKIFEPFFTTKPTSERTGLGLCVVERIVSRLGGKVRVETKLGKGSTFFVTLPIKGDER